MVHYGDIPIIEDIAGRRCTEESMARPIGSNLLWELFKEYITEGPQNLVKLLNELDREI